MDKEPNGRNKKKRTEREWQRSRGRGPGESGREKESGCGVRGMKVREAGDERDCGWW